MCALSFLCLYFPLLSFVPKQSFPWFFPHWISKEPPLMINTSSTGYALIDQGKDTEGQHDNRGYGNYE